MENAQERQARLQKLREAAQAANPTPDANKSDDRAKDTPTVKFRNYKPRNETLNHERVEAAKARPLDEPAAEGGAPRTQQEIIESYAPKKPHLDLKRDAAKRLRRLERATQRAIDELRVEVELEEGGAAEQAT